MVGLLVKSSASSSGFGGHIDVVQDRLVAGRMFRDRLNARHPLLLCWMRLMVWKAFTIDNTRRCMRIGVRGLQCWMVLMMRLVGGLHRWLVLQNRLNARYALLLRICVVGRETRGFYRSVNRRGAVVLIYVANSDAGVRV